jgi:hypothetical protein
MRRVAISCAVALCLLMVSTRGFAARKFAAQNPPIPIADCETITQPGNYVLANDLVLTASVLGVGQGGNCLVISSSHVKIDLNARKITVACPPFNVCPEELGPVGGIGIDILNGADFVQISNGSVDNFVYGLAAEAENEHVSVNNLTLRAVVGLALSDVSFSAFTNIAYQGADLRDHGSNGPILQINGGGKNIFSNLSGAVESDAGPPDGIEVVNSNSNLISGVNVTDNSSCGSTDVLLSNDSSSNIVFNNTLFDLCGTGIGVDVGSRHNLIFGNTVAIESPIDVFAMLDQNSNCGSNVWAGNSFSNLFAAGQISASPANCIH